MKPSHPNPDPPGNSELSKKIKLDAAPNQMIDADVLTQLMPTYVPRWGGFDLPFVKPSHPNPAPAGNSELLKKIKLDVAPNQMIDADVYTQLMPTYVPR